MAETFISVEEARSQILESLEPVGTERVFLRDARDRHVAEPLSAPENSPRFDRSSRDGFAIRWEDLESDRSEFDLVDRATAGETAERSVQRGEAARIATGAALPDGADTVVMQEYCCVDEGTLRVERPPEPGRGAWIRKAGSYMEQGEVILEPCARLGAAELGMLASIQKSRLEVFRRPTVAVVSTGDELVDVDEPRGPGEIVNSNAHMLQALIEGAGAVATILPVAPDEPEPTRQRFRAAIRTADLVVSSGGVSVGDRDEVRDVIERLTGGMEFWKIRMKPGKPLAFGRSEGDRRVPIVGLPGNPNSGFVGFHQFVDPALRVLQGRAPGDFERPQRVRAVLTEPVESTPHRRHYLAGSLLPLDDSENPARFDPADHQNSGNVGLFCGANGFGLVPEGCDRLDAGDPLEVEPISLRW